MSTFRATNSETGEVVDYTADAPQQAHLEAPWQLQEIFTAVSPDPVVLEYDGPMKITPYAFRSRFTNEEKVTIEIASLDDPNANMQARAQAAALRVYLQDIAVVTYVDLRDPKTQAGVQTLEAVGLLAPGRAVEILNTPPTADEAWHGE